MRSLVRLCDERRDERAILDAEMVALKAELAREQAWTRVDADEETTWAIS
jgi:hypothetical protein